MAYFFLEINNNRNFGVSAPDQIQAALAHLTHKIWLQPFAIVEMVKASSGQPGSGFPPNFGFDFSGESTKKRYRVTYDSQPGCEAVDFKQLIKEAISSHGNMKIIELSIPGQQVADIMSGDVFDETLPFFDAARRDVYKKDLYAMFAEHMSPCSVGSETKKDLSAESSFLAQILGTMLVATGLVFFAMCLYRPRRTGMSHEGRTCLARLGCSKPRRSSSSSEEETERETISPQ